MDSLSSLQNPLAGTASPSNGGAAGAAGAAAGDSAGGLTSAPRKKSRRGGDPANQKRRCVSTACVACRKRKSKCNGAQPSCAACTSVYGTECVYDPNSDHRRKGVYREKIDSMKARNSTLQILIEAILNAAEEDVPAIVHKIRTCDSLDTVAEAILKEDYADGEDGDGDDPGGGANGLDDEYTTDQPFQGERELARKMGELRLENGLVRFIGGTSHLIYLGDPNDVQGEPESDGHVSGEEEPLTSWTEVTKDTQLVIHLINMYFNWHYPYFTTLSKSLFYRDFLEGKPRGSASGPIYCSSLLVNAMLALGCHFTSVAGAFAIAGDSRTKGDHFFAEAKRLIVENDEYEKPRLTTVQALALMSVREAGCGREAKGWVYSGMSFRMAQDIGLNLDAGAIGAGDRGKMDEVEIDARRVTFWGCFLFDKCWSNYLGRLPQLPKNSYNVPKYDVFPDEDAESWSPYTDAGFDQAAKQPSRTRAAGLQLSKLCEISSDLLLFFYHPNHMGRSSGKSVELKKLSELHRRLEEWRKEMPSEFEPKEGQLPNVILTHMFFHLQYIHLFRPFLRYAPANSPLPAHVSPRRICTANAGAISKLMRLYKKTYNLRQICNIAVYMLHSACTIHLLNLPEKTARRDIIHGVKNLEEMSEDWLCARRTLSIISVLGRKWNVEMPEEASAVLQRTDEKYGTFSTADVPSPSRSSLGGGGSPAGVSAVAGAAGAAGVAGAAAYSGGYGGSPVAAAAGQAVSTPPPAATTAPPYTGQLGSQDGLPPTSLMGSLGSLSPPNPQQRQIQNQHQRQQQQQQQHHQQQQQQIPSHTSMAGPMSTISMTDAMAAINAWASLPAVTPHAVPNYHHPQFASAALLDHTTNNNSNGGGNISSSSSTASPAAAAFMTSTGGAARTRATATTTSTRQVSPSSLYAIDGQDWFLKDGVNWHQNFETWGAAAGGAAGGGVGGGVGSGGRSGGGSELFMFRGLPANASPPGAELDRATLDALDAAMGGLDHLPGLD